MFTSRHCARTGTLTNCYTYTSHSLRERTVPLKYAGERKSTMWIPNLEFCEKYDNLNFNLRKLETPIPNRKRRSNCVACAPALYPVPQWCVLRPFLRQFKTFLIAGRQRYSQSTSRRSHPQFAVKHPCTAHATILRIGPLRLLSFLHHGFVRASTGRLQHWRRAKTCHAHTEVAFLSLTLSHAFPQPSHATPATSGEQLAAADTPTRRRPSLKPADLQR